MQVTTLFCLELLRVKSSEVRRGRRVKSLFAREKGYRTRGVKKHNILEDRNPYFSIFFQQFFPE